jgi:hypothetical protein
VPDESGMWPYLNGYVVFHAVVGVMDAPAVMSPGFTGPWALCMSVIRLRQCSACPGLGVLACACPIQMPGEAGDTACRVILVNDALARRDGECTLGCGHRFLSLFRRGILIDSVTCCSNSVACKRPNWSVALCFAFCDSAGLRCGHFSFVLLGKTRRLAPHLELGRYLCDRVPFWLLVGLISLGCGPIIQRPASGQIARRELHSIVRTISSTDQPH